MKGIVQVLLVFSLAFNACTGDHSSSSEDEPTKHAIIGKWQLAQVGDSIVIENPHVIGMEFTEDGKIIQRDGPQVYEAKYMLSDDTTTISVMEGGKVVEEFKVRSLTQQELVLEEGYDGIKFVKIK